MSPTLNTSRRTQTWNAQFPKEGQRRYILEHKMASGGLRHRFTRSLHVEVRETLYGGFSRSVAVKTQSLDVDMDGPAAGHTRLARQLAAVYDLLWLEVTHEGVILKIKNIQQVRGRWQAIRQQLSQEYDGHEVHSRLQAVDSFMEDQARIIGELGQFNYVGLLFGSFYQDCSNRSTTSRERPVRFLSTPDTVTEQQWVESADEEHSEVILGFGAEVPNDSVVEEYTGRLTLNTESSWISRGQLKITEQHHGQQTEHAFLVTQIQD